MRCTHFHLRWSIEDFSHASTNSHFQENVLSHLITQKSFSKQIIVFRNSSPIFLFHFFFCFLVFFVLFCFFLIFCYFFCVFVSFCFLVFACFSFVCVFVFFFWRIIILLLSCCFVAYLWKGYNRYLLAYKHSSSLISYRRLYQMWHQIQFTSDNKCVIIH